ncbi:MAG: nucleotidyl transferase AbiEii/AbiGii toxin family protein [Thermoleophilia bacterium]
MSLAQLELAVSDLGDLAADLVFVGGASIVLWLTDRGAPPVRPTEDVDAVIAATYAELDRFGHRLRARGFRDDGAVVCRYRHASGSVLDVMPVDPAVLGFGNEWYAQAAAHAVEVPLPSTRVIRAAAPPWLVATKLAAYRGRGRDDPMASHDFEDIVRLVDGRPELAQEIADAPEDLRAAVRTEMRLLETRRDFGEAVRGTMPPDAASQARAAVVEGRWRDITLASP